MMLKFKVHCLKKNLNEALNSFLTYLLKKSLRLKMLVLHDISLEIALISIMYCVHYLRRCSYKPTTMYIRNFPILMCIVYSVLQCLYISHTKCKLDLNNLHWVSLYPFQGTLVPKLTLGTNWKTVFLGSRPVYIQSLDRFQHNVRFSVFEHILNLKYCRVFETKPTFPFSSIIRNSKQNSPS